MSADSARASVFRMLRHGTPDVLLLRFDAGDAQTTVLPAAGSAQAFLNQYCTSCHNPALKTGQLDLKSLDPANVAPHARDMGEGCSKAANGHDAPC